MKADIHRLLELQKLLASFTQVERKNRRLHAGKLIPENDVEHSYNLAMTAWFLARWFPNLNKDLLVRYSLVHDLVEVHAGDTYIYGDESSLASKETREAEALKKLEADWSDFEDMVATIHDYENRGDAESRFVYALDKIMPIMLIYVHGGEDWREHRVSVEMLYKAKVEKVKQSPEIYEYFKALHELLLSRPDLIDASL